MSIIIDTIQKYKELIDNDDKLKKINSICLCYIDIKDISSKLYNIEELELYNCRFISNISKDFINLKRLTIKFNNKIKTIPEELNKIEYLDLEHCNNINYIPNNLHLNNLSLINCNNINNTIIKQYYPFVYILNEKNVLNTYTFDYIHCALNDNYKSIVSISNDIYNIFDNYKNKFITNEDLNNIKNQINQIDNNINLDNDDIVYYILLINHYDIINNYINNLLKLIEINKINLDDNLEININNILNNEIFNNYYLNHITENKILQLYNIIKIQFKHIHHCCKSNMLNFIRYLN